MVKAILHLDKTNLVLLGIILVMTTFMSGMFYTYAKLQMSHPLENIRAVVVEPVFVEQDLLEFTGTFDRDVSCTLQHFRLDLTNMITGDVIVLNENHLARTPAPDTGPGKDLAIEFALIMPGTIYPGRWQPEFRGAYVCRYGIFTAFKREQISINSFVITPST
jgi:hypothetical protein